MEDSMTEDETSAERERLNKMLRAREGKPGYGQNVEAIKSAIAALGPETIPVNG